MFRVELEKASLPKLEALFKALSDPSAPKWMAAGVLGGATTGDADVPGRKGSVSVAQYARWNEYGTSRIPPRPFLRTALAKYGKEWAGAVLGTFREKLRNASAEGGDIPRLALMAAGRLAGPDIVRTIKDAEGWAVPNAPAYARWKAKCRDDGISRPLFLTGTLSKSIQYQLEASDGSVVWREESR